MLDKRKGYSKKDTLSDVMEKEGVQIVEDTAWHKLVDAHSTNLKAVQAEEQINRLLSQFSIPDSWYEMIAAYYLSDDGMAEFERESYNLRQELNRAKELYSNGFINLAQFQEKALTIGKSLENYQPTAQPQARDIIPLIRDFKKAWASLSAIEKKKLLKVMFLSIYFDTDSTMRLILAHEPFDRLLPISKAI